MKVLILRFSAIGDIILTSPVVRCLKKKFPAAEIHYATKPAFAALLQHNPLIDKVHLLDASLGDLIKRLRSEQFDCIIDLHNNLRTWFIKAGMGIKAYSLNKHNLDKILLTNFKVDRFPHTHISQRMLAVCMPLGVEDDGQGLDYFIPPADEVDLINLPEGFQNGYIGWGIGASMNTKKLPVAKIVEVLKQFSKPVVLLGGREDTADGEAILQALPGKAIYNACGKYSLNQSASLVRQAGLILSNDTSIMHIGAAFKKKVISFWGNTTPRFGMSPYYGNLNIPQKVFEVQGLSCHPCSRLGYDKCPKGHFKCMNLIDTGDVLTVIESFN
jgi:ADP-heptose:LPS heptosyltransferase